MAARKKKSARKAGGRANEAKKARKAKKTAGKAPARKKKAAATKKVAARKPAATRKKTPAPKKAAKTATPEKAGAKPGFSSADVHLGQIFALRPRISTSFRQEDFRTARHLLEDESFDSAESAARAVAEKALELTHDGPPGSKKGRGGRRW